jgi:hypothetical protein
MITSLVDFSFIRSLVAHCYSPFGPPCYDPPSIFLIDLFRFLDGCLDANEILPVLRDNDRGRAYRSYAGISLDRVPCEATLSNFRKRIGGSLYNLPRQKIHQHLYVQRQLTSIHNSWDYPIHSLIF